MTIATNLMNQLDNANVLFNVSEELLTTSSGIVIPNKKALINTQSGKVMGIVSNQYRTVSNQEIFETFTKEIEQSDLNTDDVQVKVKFHKNGAKTLVDFIFPNETIEVNGDKTALSITALNSFDGSTRYVTKAGGFRMKCANGQVLGKVAGSYTSLHNPKLDVQKGAERVMKMVQEFQNAQEYWDTLLERNLDGEVVDAVIMQFLGLDPNADEDIFRKPNVSKVYNLWSQYKKELGNNAFALYNVFTDFITHGKYKEGSEAHALLRNQSKLETLMATNDVFNTAH